MDKKSKEALRRYKRARQTCSSSDSSSSSDSESGSSSSYSSSDSGRRHRHKKTRPAAAQSSSSDDERRKREKREHCQKKLEAKRNHLKRKLKEAKLKKKAAAAAAALSGHSHRALSPSTQAKLKKLAERKHLRAASKEKREREREKHRAAARERERDHHRVNSRSPTKITKIRIHQDVKRQNSPPRMHHQLMSREKIIIQTRTRERSPSVDRDRQRHELKIRHEEMMRDRERREREVARDKERSEALARCQERQRERERLAREKLRRDDDEKYVKAGSGERERLLPRQSERELAIVNARTYNSRERSLERCKREVDPYNHAYMRKHREEGDYLREDDNERQLHMEREEVLREREYVASRRRELSPGEYGGGAPGGNRMQCDPREEMFVAGERDRPYKRPYAEDNHSHVMGHEPWMAERDMRERNIHDQRDYREMEPKQHLYRDERDRAEIMRERPFHRPAEWKQNWSTPQEHSEWAEGGIPAPDRGIGFVGGPKRGGATPVSTKMLPNREQRPPSEPDWDVEEGQIESTTKPDASNRRDGPLLRDWVDHGQRDVPPPIRQEQHPTPPVGAPHRPGWTPDWRENDKPIAGNYQRPPPLMHRPHSERGGRGGYRRGGGIMEHGERLPGVHMHGYRHRGHGPLLSLPMGTPPYHGGPHMPRFPFKRSMTYTNPNILRKQQAALAAATTAVAAAKAAAQSAANSVTNPGILSQMNHNNMRMSYQQDEKPELGEIIGDNEHNSNDVEANANVGMGSEKKTTGELSEISDSDDDILNKNEKKLKMETEDTSSQEQILIDNEKDTKSSDEKVADEDILAFEEISDGELEEEAKTKGVADALGVDWASLVAETKRVPKDPITTAKQKWQPYRIFLEVGVSLHMAGAEYAKQLLKEAQQKLNEELQQESAIKAEIKQEHNAEEESQQTKQTDDKQTPAAKIKTESNAVVEGNGGDMDHIHALACVQVAERKRQLERKNLIANACGMNSRALSARQDLQLRRQLCGLPARECDFGRSIPPPSDQLKAMALAAFQRTLEVK